MTDMTVANTILEQLGKNRFIAMTGAKNFVGSDDALSFKLPSNFAKGGINAVRIRLDTSRDTYEVTFSKIRGTKVTQVSTFNDVYADSLRSLFTSETGLDTSLGSVDGPWRAS